MTEDYKVIIGYVRPHTGEWIEQGPLTRDEARMLWNAMAPCLQETAIITEAAKKSKP